jgi:hypothetical protein
MSSKRRIRALERARDCLRLVKMGKSFDAIAKDLGYASRGAAYGAFKLAISKLDQETRDEVRALLLERLRDGVEMVMAAICDKHLPLEQRLAALDRLIKIDAAIAKRFGLDAPQEMAAAVMNINLPEAAESKNPSVSALIQRMHCNPDARLAAAEYAELEMTLVEGDPAASGPAGR